MTDAEIAAIAAETLETIDENRLRLHAPALHVLTQAAAGQPFHLALLQRVVSKVGEMLVAEARALEREQVWRFGNE